MVCIENTAQRYNIKLNIPTIFSCFLLNVHLKFHLHTEIQLSAGQVVGYSILLAGYVRKPIIRVNIVNA